MVNLIPARGHVWLWTGSMLTHGHHPKTQKPHSGPCDEDRKVKDLYNTSWVLTQSKIHGSRGHLGTFHGHYGLCWVQFWHEWAGRGCAYVFRSPGIVYCCSRKQMRWFITYQKPRALRDMTNTQQTLTSDSSFETQISCLLEDMF